METNMTTETNAGTATAFVGTCPVCENEQKLNRDNADYRMVLHGYARPGDGWVVGRCFGVDRLAWEVSPEGAVSWKLEVERMLAATLERLAVLESGTVTSFEVDDHSKPSRRTAGGRRCYERKTVTRDGDAYEFARELKRRVYNVTAERDSQGSEILRQEARIVAWAPGEIRTAAKAASIAADIRAARGAERDAARVEKLKVQAARERISALRSAVDYAMADAAMSTRGIYTYSDTGKLLGRVVDLERAERCRANARVAAEQLAPLVGKTVEQLLKFYAKKHK